MEIPITLNKLKETPVFAKTLTLYKKYPLIVDTFVEFQIDVDFIKKYIFKSNDIYYNSGGIRDDAVKKTNAFIDELVEYIQGNIYYTSSDNNINTVDITKICNEIKHLFPTIEITVTEIPFVAYTDIPLAPDISALRQKFSTILEETEEDKEEDMMR